MIRPPAKPFPRYKWRWLSANASEGLLKAPVFLGVLRALAAHEGEPFTSAGLQADLRVVEQDTNSSVSLARARGRNLFRNMGQYWRGTGLLGTDRGVIRLTPIGRRVASGRLTRDEFASLMVQQTVLPNPVTYSAAEVAEWRAARLSIRPLHLILQVMGELARPVPGGLRRATLTPDELVKVVIPLAGDSRPSAEMADAIRQYRDGKLDVSGWPNCAPDTNDPRLAREFLLFLANFGLLGLASATTNRQDVFSLELPALAGALPDVPEHDIFDEAAADEVVAEMHGTGLPETLERRRVLANVLARPGQARFRRLVLGASNQTCLLSGERLAGVLEAAHIRPVSEDGTDAADNGLCLRVDLHRLYDAGDIRIEADGSVILADTLQASPSYGLLPNHVDLPAYVSRANLDWRSRYL